MHREYKGKKVLVTGGAGFIGSSLVPALLEQGAQVTVLDDLSTGSIDNLVAVFEKITFIKGSITDYETCLQAAYDQSIVFHLAAIASVSNCRQYPERCDQINIEGTRTLLSACKEANVKRFVLSSSAAVYGNLNGICQETAFCNPTSEYGYSKLMNELDCIEFQQKYALSCSILRYFNVYDEKQNGSLDHAGVMAKFTYRMENDLPITIYGDGSQTRDFVPLHAVVQANLFLGIAHDQYPKNIFNIGSGKSTSVKELFYILKQRFPHYHHEPEFMPAQPDEAIHSRADITRYQALVNRAFTGYQTPSKTVELV